MNKGCILAPAAAPPLGLRPAAPAGVVARSLHATRHARRSRLASGPGGQQQNVTVIHYQALSPDRRGMAAGLSLRTCGEAQDCPAAPTTR